jgi:preprotein translocase SecE subunit
MKKVNWPSRRDVIGSTIVVISGTLMFTLFLWLIDLGFAALFIEAGVLESGGG